MAYFAVLHFISDYFRNPVFRAEFEGKSQPEQLAVLRDQYRFSDADVAVIRSDSRDALIAHLGNDVKVANTHQPEWDGVMQASPRTPVELTVSAPMGDGDGDENASGWPGGAWVCVEKVVGETVVPAGQRTVELQGWNLSGKTIIFDRAGDELAAFTIVSEAHEPNGRSTVTGQVTLAAGTWSIRIEQATGGSSRESPSNATLENALRVL